MVVLLICLYNAPRYNDPNKYLLTVLITILLSYCYNSNNPFRDIAVLYYNISIIISGYVLLLLICLRKTRGRCKLEMYWQKGCEPTRPPGSKCK